MLIAERRPGTADVRNKLTASLMLAIIFDHDGRLNADILCNIFKVPTSTFEIVTPRKTSADRCLRDPFS